MSSVRSFALPDVGEGLTEAEIVRWLVAVGDVVEVNQMVMEIETAKAVVELPCPFAGHVNALLVREGEVVPVGTAILAVEVAEPSVADDLPTREAVLIGYGVAEEGVRRRRIGRAKPAAAANNADVPPDAAPPLAKPPVRALARARGIDLANVSPSGPYGDVTRDDLNRHAGDLAPVRTLRPEPQTPGQRIPVRSVQRAMAEAMVRSVSMAPHVTEWVDVDVRRTVQLIERLKADGMRITPLAVVAAAIVHGIRRTPIVNSSWVDLPTGDAEIHLHAPINLGVAVASPRGLVVPNIQGIDRMSMTQMAEALADLTDRARTGALTPADSSGGTITVTNVGVFGIDGGTPILNPGEAAILAMGRIRDRPWAVGGGLTVRPVMQLSLSFDHRVVDGAAGSTFLADVAAYLEDPPTPSPQ